MTSPLKDHMLVDSALQQEIVRRALAGNLSAGQPVHAVDDLGMILMPDGRQVSIYLRHAVDAILIDDRDTIVLITRRHNPGAGREALPGGFLDPVRDHGGSIGVEEAREAALREAMEEVGVSAGVLATAMVCPVGARSYDRPFDIREAWSDIPSTPIRKGDLFMVSTQAFLIRIKGDLSQVALKAGDDASQLRIERVSALRPEQFAVPDHLPMILLAASSECRRPR